MRGDDKVESFIIGVSSPSGGGKTTVVNRLADCLGDTAVISFDEYDEASTIIHPASFQRWLETGADYNAWRASRLALDLQRLKSGQEIMSPCTGHSVLPAAYIIFDAPLGRAHHETGKYIDFLVYIETPLDVAMARRILREFNDETGTLSTEQYKQLRMDLEFYLDFGRDAYLEMDRQVKPGCDQVVNGLLSPNELAALIIEAVEQILTRNG